MTRESGRLAAVALVSLALGACDGLGMECTTSFEPGIVVTALDDMTGDTLPEPLMWVQDDEYVDTLDVDFGTGIGAGERAGVYDVHVEHEGYETWVQDDVLVRDGDCHVQTRRLTARLEPALPE